VNCEGVDGFNFHGRRQRPGAFTRTVNEMTVIKMKFAFPPLPSHESDRIPCQAVTTT
jgi:hypothetical protein